MQINHKTQINKKEEKKDRPKPKKYHTFFPNKYLNPNVIEPKKSLKKSLEKSPIKKKNKTNET